MIKKVNYLNNSDMMLEIHRSKSAYSYFIDEKYQDYDHIVTSKDEITEELISTLKAKRASSMMSQMRAEQKQLGTKISQIKVETVDPESIPTSDLVFRYITWEHIPQLEVQPAKIKKESDKYLKLNFTPFKHLILENNELIEVGRSHWKNGLHNGEFSKDHGKMTRKLADMIVKLVDKFSMRYNWRGYTYVDEMRSQAGLQLAMMALKFDEHRTNNPFAYYTMIIDNAFKGVLNSERKNQKIRDDILIMHGATPSSTRQLDDELSQKDEVIPMPVKRIKNKEQG